MSVFHVGLYCDKCRIIKPLIFFLKFSHFHGSVCRRDLDMIFLHSFPNADITSIGLLITKLCEIIIRKNYNFHTKKYISKLSHGLQNAVHFVYASMCQGIGMIFCCSPGHSLNRVLVPTVVQHHICCWGSPGLLLAPIMLDIGRAPFSWPCNVMYRTWKQVGDDHVNWVHI